MSQVSPEITKEEVKDRQRRFAEHYAGKFSGSVVRYTQIANERVNSLSRLLFEVAGVAVALVGAHLLLNPYVGFPYSRLGLLLFIVSACIGAWQMWMDSRFFAEHARIDGELDTCFAHIYIGSDSSQELVDEARRWLDIKASIPKSSDQSALLIQCIFVIIAISLVFYELFVR